MRKVFIAILAAASLSASAQEWKLDKSHSSINFSIEHMVISETKGQFKKFEVAVTSAKSDFTDLKGTVTIDANSVNTEDEGRDKHLVGEDFFNTAKNPTMVYEITGVKKVSGKNYMLMGKLTMNGVTKPLNVAAVYGGTIKDPYGNTRAGFRFKGTIDRFAHGMNYGKSSPLEGGGLAIGQKVDMTGSIELIKG
jgi:polyisoprenoid-binding protein YceI